MNEVGYESGNDTMTDGRDLAWLQETEAEAVWSVWQVGYRDVWVLDPDNKPVDVYNLTEHDLTDDANYDALKALFLAASER